MSRVAVQGHLPSRSGGGGGVVSNGGGKGFAEDYSETKIKAGFSAHALRNNTPLNSST